MLNFFTKKTSSKQWPKLSLDEIKKRARILVIDDDDFAYVSLFQQENYVIDKWDDINDLGKLENGTYDLILLDIQGIGQKISEEQGFGVLKHLKKVSPSQIIIAYSNADYSLKYQDFFDMADSRLHKSADFTEFKRKVDEFLKMKFSFGFYVDRILNVTNLTQEERIKIKSNLEVSILENDLTDFEVILKNSNVSKEMIQIALSIAQVAIGVASL